MPLHANVDRPFGYGNGMVSIKINGTWAYTIFESTNRNYNNGDICKNAMLFLTNCEGTWTTEDGTVIKGYLTFKPKGEKIDE